MGQQENMLHTIARSLCSDNNKEMLDAAATLRSLLLGPTEGDAVSNIISTPLVESLQRASTEENISWILFAMCRMAQFKSCQEALLHAGVVDALMEARHGKDSTSMDHDSDHNMTDRDALIYHILAFLSESGGYAVATIVPQGALERFKNALKARLLLARDFAARVGTPKGDCDEACEVVGTRSFYGFPLYYRPRFIVQALASLAGASGEQAQTCWRIDVAPMIIEVLLGSLPNDPSDNKPYGSPDAVDLCLALAACMLRHAGGCAPDDHDALKHAVSQATNIANL